MSDWLYDDLLRVISWGMENGKIVFTDAEELARLVTDGYRAGQTNIGRILNDSGGFVVEPAFLKEAHDLALKTLKEETVAAELKKLTVSIDEIGGGQAFLDHVDAFTIAAQTQQRTFSADLDRRGPGNGRIRFDPFLREFEIRNHVFEAELIGSFSGTWLWAWSNKHLALSSTMDAISRKLRDLDGTVFATSPCIDFGTMDPQLVQNKIGCWVIGSGLADGYYVANGNQLYAIAKGQIDTNGTLTNFLFALNDELLNGIADAPKTIEKNAVTVGLQVSQASKSMTLTDGTKDIVIQFDDLNRISKIEAEL